MELDLAKFMPVDEVKVGMKGIGKTVFTGTKIEEFQIEVLGIDKNANGPGNDIIWILCSGQDLEEIGVMRGMSGSPIYIDNRLVGALAYTFPFSKRPIAGVTPIADMLGIIEKAEKESSVKLGGMSNWSFAQKADTFNEFYEGWSETPVLASNDYTASPMPIQTPIMLSGFHQKTIDEIAPMLKRLGMTPVQGGGASSQDELEDAPFEPGSVLGVQYVRGDMSAVGTGTVTYINDGKVLAFGHMMDDMGKTSLPMTAGRAILIVPSITSSFRRASAAQTMGTITYDNDFGIMGIIGKEPEFIPMKVLINSQEYNFEIVKHKMFAPTYIFSIALNTIYVAEKSVGDYTIKTHSEIKLKGYPTISKDNVFSGRSPGIAAAAFASPIYSLMQNRFEEVDIESILLEISFENKRTNAVIDEIRISKDRVRPGGSVTATVFITPYMEDTMTKQIEVTIPEDMPEGPAFLIIADAKFSSSWEKSRAPMKAQTVDVPHLIQRIQEEENNSDLIVKLFVSKLGVTIRNQELPALPLTTFSVMNSRKQMGGSGVTRGTTFLKKRVRTDYVIAGNAMMFLMIDRDAP